MPTRLHIPKDRKRRATRALHNLNRPGVAAAYFGSAIKCRIGEYSPETESEHLLQCAEYPKEAQLNIQKRKDVKPAAPSVGIIYLVGRKLLIDATPLSQAARHGDHLIHDPNHHQYWAQLVSSGAVPDDEYEEHPRGRVAFNEKTGKYTLLADRCIIGKKSLVAKIVSRLNLPPKNTETGTDSHYRCFHCLSRGG